MNPNMTYALGIDIIGVAVGLISVAKMLKLNRILGGRIGNAVNLVVGGVTLNVLAFLWTIVFTRLKLFAPPALDIHHLLMTIGMALFVFAARKFSALIQG